MFVYVTALGLRPFRITKMKQFTSDSPIQYKGQYKLPKGVKLGNGKKWVDLDYWFEGSQIKSSSS